MSQSQGAGRSKVPLKNNKKAQVAGQGAGETLASDEAGQK